MRFLKFAALLLSVLLLCACAAPVSSGGVAATTGPVAQFARAIAAGTDVTVTQVIADSVSCLHDYSLSVRQMQTIENSRLVLISGAGLEAFMEDALAAAGTVADCSEGVSLLHLDEHEDHDHGEYDPHIWLDPDNAAIMARNICTALTQVYPDCAGIFQENTDQLIQRLQALDDYGTETLADLSCRQLITFHDGFAYLAQAYDLKILEAIEEESGSEASAAELISIIQLIADHHLPAVFTEANGSVSAAGIIQAETGVPHYALDMALGGSDYFDAMKHNIDTLKEALQ